MLDDASPVAGALLPGLVRLSTATCATDVVEQRDMLRDIGSCERSGVTMPYQPIKYYQAGSFVVGNRLLDPEQRTVQADPRRSNTLTSGHRACQGCGEALGARYVLDAAMRATGDRVIAANATGCLEVFSTPSPESSWQLPWIHSLFGNAPAVATGVAAALKVKGRTDVRVVGQAGDGGTVDIGFGCLSGMFERNDDVLFVCYDNEALHEHRRAALRRDAAGRPHRDDAGGRARTRATASARARTCRASPWRTRSPTSRRRRSPTCTTSRRRSSARWSCAARATCTCW